MATSSAAPATPATPAQPKASRPLPVAKKIKQPLAANTYIAIVACISGLVVIVCLFVGYRLLGRVILDVKVISKEAQAQSDLSTKLNNASTVVTNYNNLGSSTQQLIADALPSGADFNQLVSLMGNLSQTAGVQLLSIAPVAASPSAAPTTSTTTTANTGGSTATPFAFAVEVQGPYSQLVNYFHNLELSDRPMRVTAASFTGGSGNVQAQLNIDTYYQGAANISDNQVSVK